MGKQTFTADGTWINPGVTSVRAKIWPGGGGGGGGGSSGAGGDGGPGGWLDITFTILSTDDLDIDIGGGGGLGTGGSTSGDGAGGGGGSSVINQTGTVLIGEVPGGGGGGGGDNSSTTAGGEGGFSAPPTADAGADSGTATGGGGATATAGGAAGTGADNGGVGTVTAGGEGGSNNATVGGAGGAHGGGDGGGQDTSGFAGGGGGGGGSVVSEGWGGGGGGSSVSGNAGGGGGGGGATFAKSGETVNANEAGGPLRTDVGGDADADYPTGVGEGGDGGATTANGTAGANGAVVLLWTGASITDVSLGKNVTDDPLRPNTTGAIVTGVDFGASQGSGNLWLINNATWGSETIKVAQDVTSWADTSLTFSVTFGPHIQGDQLWLVVEPNTGPVSNTCQVLASFPDFDVQESGSITTPSSTGLQTVWTPTKAGFGGPTSVHPVRAFFIEAIGNTANDTAQTEVGKYMGVVIDSDGEQLQLGWASAHTDGVGATDDVRYQGDSVGFALYADGTSTTPQTLGTLSISSGGALQCNFSTNANNGEKLRIVAFAGRTLRARIKTDVVTGSPMTGIDVPSNPSLAIFGGVGQTWSDAGEAFGKFQVGFWDGKASANAWWAAAHWSSTTAINAIVQSSAGFGQYNGVSNSYEHTALAYGADGDNRQLTWTGGSSSDEWGGLFLWTDGFDCDTGVVSKETTGTDDVTQNIVSGLAYDPAFAFMLTASRTNEDPTLDFGVSARWATGRGVRSDLTTQGALTSTIILNASVYDCDSIVTQAADRIMMAHDDVTAAVDFAGEATDMKGGKVEVTWRTADTRAAVIGYMTLETSESGVPEVFMGPAL